MRRARARTGKFALLFALLLAVSFGASPELRADSSGKAPPPLRPLRPIDPQQVQDQQDMTWNDYHPIPGMSWATSGAVPTKRSLRVALLAVDYPDQPFVITQPKHSDPFGNPQIDPVSRDQVSKFYADFF